MSTTDSGGGCKVLIGRGISTTDSGLGGGVKCLLDEECPLLTVWGVGGGGVKCLLDEEYPLQTFRHTLSVKRLLDQILDHLLT